MEVHAAAMYESMYDSDESENGDCRGLCTADVEPGSAAAAVGAFEQGSATAQPLAAAAFPSPPARRSSLPPLQRHGYNDSALVCADAIGDVPVAATTPPDCDSASVGHDNSRNADLVSLDDEVARPSTPAASAQLASALRAQTSTASALPGDSVAYGATAPLGLASTGSSSAPSTSRGSRMRPARVTRNGPLPRTPSTPSAPSAWRPAGIAGPSRPTSRPASATAGDGARSRSQGRVSRNDIRATAATPARLDCATGAGVQCGGHTARISLPVTAPTCQCKRIDSCDCADCVAGYDSYKAVTAAVAGAASNAVVHIRTSHRLVKTVFESHWALVPDVVLLQAVVSLGPGELCAAACACSTWAETVTASEEWLWSIVGSMGASVPPSIFELLRQWSREAKVNLRYALQLWLCRSHLWSGGAWATQSNDNAHEAVNVVECVPLPCDAARVCCTAWTGSGGEGPGAAVGTAGGLLAFCSLTQRRVPACGLRGTVTSSMEVVASVRAAHGRELITSVRPFNSAGQRAISSGLDGLLRIWDCRSAAELEQVRTEHTRGINALALCPGETSHVMCCGDDGLALTYDVMAAAGARDAQPLQRFEGHTASAYCGAWLSCDRFATGGFDRRTLLWDRRSPSGPTAALAARQHVYAVAALGRGGCYEAESTVATSLAVALSDGTISHWDLRQTSKQPLREMRGHGGSVEEMAVLPGDVLASVSADGTLRLWDAGKNGEPCWLWSGSRGPLTGVTATFEDSLMVVGAKQEPVVLTLDYSAAVNRVPEVLARLRLPGLRPWSRRPANGGLMAAPPEGHGRHSALLRKQRLQRGAASRRGMRPHRAEDFLLPPDSSSPRGAFDRSQKVRAAPLGSTGAAHRAYLCGARR